MRKVYLDHAASTYLNLEVEKAMRFYGREIFGNPSSVHQFGRKAKEGLEEARKKVSHILNCHSSEIIFTNGGTESCNLAIFGVARANKKYGNHIITTQIEHKAVLEPCHQLEKEGFSVTYLPVDEDGLVDPQEVKKSLTPKTILVAVMYVNNEIGTIEPIQEIGKIIRNYKKKIYFYSDACQAAGYLDLDVKKIGVDFLTISGSKIYGPKSAGALYIKQGALIEPLIFGSGQEFNLRSGTQNVSGIVGLAKALEVVRRHKQKESKRLLELRDYLTRGIFKLIPQVIINGSMEKRLPNNLNVSIPGVDSEFLLFLLDKNGIAVSSASACFDKKDGPSHVLKALGKFSPQELARQAHIRISLGKMNTKEDIDYFIKVLDKILNRVYNINA